MKRDFNKIVCCYTIKIPVSNFKTFSIIGNRPWVSFNIARQINQGAYAEIKTFLKNKK